MPYAIIISAVIGVTGYILNHRLNQKSEIMAKKRQVYEEIAQALSVFVSGRVSNINDKDKFLDCFSKLWLWASDSVVRAANEFADIMLRFDSSNSLEQEKAKLAFSKFVLEMRKDLGFFKTELKPEEYKFFSFGK